MDILSEFRDPSPIYRTAPFWIWNDEMDKDEITRQLREMKSHGFGGAFAHARLGLITPYLTEEWFDAFTHTLKICKELGMKLYIYDENNWPSGNAGGHVTHGHPEFGTHRLERRTVSAEHPDFNGKLVRAWSYDGKTKKTGTELTGIPTERWKEYGDRAIVTYVDAAEYDPNFDPNRNAEANTVDPEAMRKFIEVTHEEYYKRYGEDFGDTIPGIFTDEPCQPQRPWDRGVQEKFYEMHGYHIEDYVPYLFSDDTGIEGVPTDRTPEKVRYDYTETRHTLWNDSYMKPIYDWCEKHNIAFTGHLIEHEWPATTCPAPMSSYEYMQWPGTDGLACDHLQTVSYACTSFQAEELRSVANQLGKERILNEMYGVGMWEVTFEQLKRIEDWWMANGTNQMCQHLMHATVSGVRKRDCVQSFDWRQPWWDQYAVLNEYTARAQYLLTNGKMEQRVLLLNMNTTAYTIVPETQVGHENLAVTTDYIKNPDCFDFLELVKELTCRQWDYDLGDEYIIEHHAKIEDGRFVVGNQRYEAVIVSRNMKCMRSSTVRLLKEFIRAGGKVYTTGARCVEFTDGQRDDPATEELFGMWMSFMSRDHLIRELENTVGNRIECLGGWEQGFEHMRRDYGDGRVGYFLINHAFRHQDIDVVLPGDSVSRWNLFTGEVEPVQYVKVGDRVCVSVSLDRQQSVFLMTGDGTAPAEAPEYSKTITETPKFTSADREWLNIIPLTQCDLIVDGEEHKDLPYYKAQKELFSHRHMRNPWGGIQFMYETLDKNKDYGEGSGFEVIYRFSVAPGVRPSVVNLITERPELINVDLNGEKLTWDGTTHLMDRHMGVFPVADKIRDGENIVRLWADRFDIRDEIEAIYVEGDFAVTEVGGGYGIGADKAPVLGDWTRNSGMEFYPGAVTYHFNLSVSELPQSAILDTSDTIDTISSVTVNGKDGGLLGGDGDRKAEIAGLLQKGDNEISVRVCGSYVNLFGPINYTEGYKNMYDYESLPTGKPILYGDIEPHPYGLMSAPKVTMKF